MEADGVEYIERQSKYLAVSAYALATGAYGKQDDWLYQLSSHENLVGMVKSQELIKQLSEYKTQTDKVGTINSRTDTITAIGRVQYPLTFAALATFRRIPSEQNYTALETAVRAERPTDAAAEQIALLANATVPEGSISLPA
ncbi:hypothetical protein, partial [Mesorhizobium sp. M4B.F.Ca.ET.211.01.1.1]|uniref:hypothetical protein n=1 Tax=Mesorhizobium sp. M4B.F.Ca.ET.211.01.1.1 TaxID=2563954 RepID=UPI001677ECC4